MGFFELKIDALNSYVFREEDLRAAQDVWRDALARVGESLGSVEGSRIHTLLVADTAPAASSLIVLARALHVLSRHLTRKSVVAFDEKLRELFRVSSPAQFDELASELEIGALITGMSTPVALEPYVPTDAPSHAKARSPDYAIRTPDGDIAIEATTLNVEAFERLDRLKKSVSRRLANQVDKRKAFVSFAFEMPLSTHSVPAGSLLTRAQVRSVFTQDTGELTIPLGANKGTLRWHPMPVIGPGDPFPDGAPAFAQVSHEGAVGSGHSWSFSVKAEPAEIEKTVLASLRQTLDAKLTQHRGSEPLLVVLRMGNHRLRQDAVADIVVRRIWPNPRYKRLTGIGFFEPWIPQRHGTRPARIVSLHNPQATPPATQAFVNVISGAESYHAA